MILLIRILKPGYVLERKPISENKDSATSKTHCKMNSENCIRISIYIYKCLHSKLFIVYGHSLSHQIIFMLFTLILVLLNYFKYKPHFISSHRS